MRTLERVIAAMTPHHDIFGPPIGENVRRTVLSFVPFLPLPMRHGLPVVLLLFECAPVLFGRGFGPFSKLDDGQAARYLGQWEHGRWPLSMIFSALHALILCSYYQQPEVLRALEIDWQARAEELTVRRARLLEMKADLANPRNVRPEAGSAR